MPDGMKNRVKIRISLHGQADLLAAQGLDARAVRTLLALNDTDAPQPSPGVSANQDEKTNALPLSRVQATTTRLR